MANEMTHKERIEWRDYLLRKRLPRYHVTMVRRDTLPNGQLVDNPILVRRDNDLDTLREVAEEKAPAYVVDDHARPAPEVVYIALPRQAEAAAQNYMQPCE